MGDEDGRGHRIHHDLQVCGVTLRLPLGGLEITLRLLARADIAPDGRDKINAVEHQVPRADAYVQQLATSSPQQTVHRECASLEDFRRLAVKESHRPFFEEIRSPERRKLGSAVTQVTVRRLVELDDPPRRRLDNRDPLGRLVNDTEEDSLPFVQQRLRFPLIREIRERNEDAPERAVKSLRDAEPQLD